MRRHSLVLVVVAALLAAPGFVTLADARSSTGVGVAGATSSTSPRKAPPQLHRKGRWLIDGQGRVVIVHGLNLVYKHAPYAPPKTAAGFLPRDARWMERHGFNAARVGTLWAGVTPKRPGVADPKYFARWQRVMDLLAKHHVWMQVDMHQDQWNETYGGEGVPDWAVHRPSPYNLTPPVTAPFPEGYWLPELSTLFDDFWANKFGLVDDWVDTWKIMVRHWQDQPYLMGYDLFNEPWMGLEWPNCLTLGCESSITGELQPAYDKALAAIRKIDRNNIVWYEPQQFAGGQPVETYLQGVRGEKQLGLSWHNYCPQVFLFGAGVPGADPSKCRSYSSGRAKHALAQAASMHAVPMMSEWAATDLLPAIHIDADVADRHLMGWTHWAYKLWHDPTGSPDEGLFRNDANLGSAKHRKLLELVRTYAQAVAGTPLTMHFDTENGAFRFRYRPDRSITAPTQIFVSPLHYPHGYRVLVEHGRVVDRTRRLVSIRPNSSRVVTVRVVRRTS